MPEYEMLSQQMRESQVDARLLQIEQELFNAQLNLEMEMVVDDADRAPVVEQNRRSVAMAEARLARLREIRAELVAQPAPVNEATL